MRQLWFAFAVGLIGVVSIAGLTSPGGPYRPWRPSPKGFSPLPGSRALRGGPAGVVTTTEGRPVGGLTVQIGRYEFPVLESGSYTLRLARPLEFRRSQRDAVCVDGTTPLADIIVERVADGDFLPPERDMLPQLTCGIWPVPPRGSSKRRVSAGRGR